MLVYAPMRFGTDAVILLTTATDVVSMGAFLGPATVLI